MNNPTLTTENGSAENNDENLENTPIKMTSSTPPVEASKSVYSRNSQASRIKNSTQEDIVYTLVVIPPDGGWGWVVLAASFLINFIMDGTIYSLGLFLEEIAEYMGTYPTRVAYASSILIGVNLLTGTLVHEKIHKIH